MCVLQRLHGVCGHGGGGFVSGVAVHGRPLPHAGGGGAVFGLDPHAQRQRGRAVPAGLPARDAEQWKRAG